MQSNLLKMHAFLTKQIGNHAFPHSLMCLNFTQNLIGVKISAEENHASYMGHNNVTSSSKINRKTPRKLFYGI
jgi:hypothetical protein